MKSFSATAGMLRTQGQGLVEFALVLPILLTITLGIVDFGRVMFTFAMASNSVRDALRHASLEGFVLDETLSTFEQGQLPARPHDSGAAVQA